MKFRKLWVIVHAVLVWLVAANVLESLIAASDKGYERVMWLSVIAGSIQWTLAELLRWRIEVCDKKAKDGTTF